MGNMHKADKPVRKNKKTHTFVQVFHQWSRRDSNPKPSHP